MPLADATVTAMLGGLTATHVSAHTAIPNGAGNAEVTGGSYARVPLALAAASGRTRASSAAATINIPAGVTVVAYGYWTALSGGTFLGWSPVQPANAKMGVGVVATPDIATETIEAPAHGLVVGQQVVLYGAFGAALPAGLLGTVVYFVKSTTTDTFTLSLTNGGATVDITGGGSLVWQQASPETFQNAGQLSAASGTLVFDLTAVPA